jgi:hypothetical protein
MNMKGIKSLNPVINRRQFNTMSLFSAGTLVAPSVMAQGFRNFVVDHDDLVLAPDGIVNYKLGEPSMRVKMGFNSHELKKEVVLRPEGKVSVNGVELKLNHREDPETYMAHIPVGDGVLNFEIRRSVTVSTKFSIVLPIFNIVEFPNKYVYPNPLSFRIEKPLPAGNHALVENRFSMGILSGRLTVYAFKDGINETPNDRLQRRNFKMIPLSRIPIVNPVKNAVADIFCYQRVALRDVTQDYASGWVVMTVSQNLPIELPLE